MMYRQILNRIFYNIGKNYSQSSPQGKRNPWVLAWFSIIAVFLVVNGIFVVFAIVSNPGLVVDDYYEQGRQYENNAIKRMTMYNKLQWESKLEVPETVTLNKSDTYRFSATDSRGLPVTDAEVTLVAYRPSDASADFTTTLLPIAPGLYQGALSFPLPGVWDLNVKVRHGEDHLELVHRLAVQSVNP